MFDFLTGRRDEVKKSWVEYRLFLVDEEIASCTPVKAFIRQQKKTTKCFHAHFHGKQRCFHASAKEEVVTEKSRKLKMHFESCIMKKKTQAARPKKVEKEDARHCGVHWE